MAKSHELAFLDATAQAELVRKKEVTPTELVEATIERIERLNPELNAVVTPMYDLAREAAKGDPGSGPFAGVPFLLKDLGAAYGGVRQTIGSAFGKDNQRMRLANLANHQVDRALVNLDLFAIDQQGAKHFRQFSPHPAFVPIVLGRHRARQGTNPTG